MACHQLHQLHAPEGQKRRLTNEDGVRPVAPIIAKAASISPLVLALRTWICSPMARAAGSMALSVSRHLTYQLD